MLALTKLTGSLHFHSAYIVLLRMNFLSDFINDFVRSGNCSLPSFSFHLHAKSWPYSIASDLFLGASVDRQTVHPPTECFEVNYHNR